MKKTTILFFLLTISLFVSGQPNDNQLTNNTLRGKMLFLSSGKTPAVGVAISGSIIQQGTTTENANNVHTTDKGDYALKFSKERDGNYVKLTIGKEDQYGKSIELVNVREVEQCRIPADPADEFEIIVCEKGARDLVAQKYYNIIKTSSDIALTKKKREFDALLAKREKDYTKIAALVEEVERLEKQTDSIAIYKKALRIASVNKDNASQRVLTQLADLIL